MADRLNPTPAQPAPTYSDKAAACGEPSYVWRAGQERRLKMILEAAQNLTQGRILENGCGIGLYAGKLAAFANQVVGLEFDFERAAQAKERITAITNSAGEALPFNESVFDLVLSHEVLEHVADDRQAVVEMVRVLRPGGRMIVFVPNRGYPFETHGITWRGTYRFGNIPFVNYLPRIWRDKLAPHVRVYTNKDLADLFTGLPLRIVYRTVVFGAYDNWIARFGILGRLLRSALQFLEKTPLKVLGLSHFWIIEKD